MLAIAAAAAASVAWFSALTYVQTHLLEGVTAKSVADLNPNSADVNFMAYGIVLGLGFTGMSAWLLMAAIPSRYRRGALAMVAALGGTTLAMVVTRIVYPVAGRSGLLISGTIGIVASLWLGRRPVLSAR